VDTINTFPWNKLVLSWKRPSSSTWSRKLHLCNFTSTYLHDVVLSEVKCKAVPVNAMIKYRGVEL